MDSAITIIIIVTVINAFFFLLTILVVHRMIKEAAKKGIFEKVYKDFCGKALIDTNIKLLQERLKVVIANKQKESAYFVANEALETRNKLMDEFAVDFKEIVRKL